MRGNEEIYITRSVSHEKCLVIFGIPYNSTPKLADFTMTSFPERPCAFAISFTL
jgi:hypothetical protein